MRGLHKGRAAVAGPRGRGKGLVAGAGGGKSEGLSPGEVADVERRADADGGDAGEAVADADALAEGPAWLRRPSKTRRKAQMHDLQALGDVLVGLSDHQLAQIDLAEELLDAIKAARGMTRLDEARRRQLQYVGRLMRDVDPEPIRARIATWQSQSVEQARALHEIERWRERLLTEESALTEFADRYRLQDMQGFRNTLREARRERADIAAGKERSPRHYRELFRWVREAIATAAAASAALAGTVPGAAEANPDDAVDSPSGEASGEENA